MPQSIYSRSVTILKRFTEVNGSNFQVIYEPGFTTPWDLLPVNRYYGFITDLRAKIAVKTLEEKPLPDLEVIQSRTERLTAVRDLEWSGTRYELSLWLETSNAPAMQIASLSLLNRMPYYHVNLLPYFTDNAIINLASDARILARIDNAGYGLLGEGDEVVIFGSVKEEVTTLPEEQREIQYCQPYSNTIGTSSVIVLETNASRLQATFVNTSPSAKIYLNYGATAVAGRGICLMPQGGSYEINSTNRYLGAVTAIADAAGATLSSLECV